MADVAYVQLKKHLESPDIVFDDASWRELARCRGRLGGAHDAAVARMRAVDLDEVNARISDVNRVQSALDALTRAPEFRAMAECARGAGKSDEDYAHVLAALRALADQLGASTAGALTPAAARAAGAMMHNIRAYTCLFTGAAHDVEAPARPPGVAVLADPLPRTDARALAAALGAWVCADPSRLGSAEPCPVSTADMLRLVAALSPECFNLLREPDASPADAWISEAAARLAPADVAVALVYLFPRQLFAQNTDIVQRQGEIVHYLFDALGKSAFRDALCRAALARVRRWERVRGLSASMGDDVYRRAMVELWTPED